MVRVLFVCLGNICRSPTAEGVFRHLVERHGLVDRIAVESAGTGDWHVGEPPDGRAVKAALRRGIDLSQIRARQARRDDFARFDYVVAMDGDNRAHLARMCPKDARHRLHLFLDFAPGLEGRDVPDPFYGGGEGFEAALDMIERAAEGLLADIRSKHL